ncbi:MAG: hypothetical protein JO261_05545, partial [Alphaproteobacteria bacterium]|nr:hypothetical protein [Alphaproteobacteria bacterium]
APCKTFAGAISKTAAGGEIDTLDPGGFGAVTVTKAITLADEGTGEGGILVAGTNGITVNCVSDPNCTVVVRGLQIDGGPVGSNSLSGIKFIAGKTLIVQNCAIRNFTGGSPNGYGIWFAPSGGTASVTLLVQNTTLQSNGVGASGTGGAIFIQPSGGTVTVNASISNSVMDANNTGVRADSTLLTGGAINVSVSYSNVTNNTNGAVAAIAQNTGGQPVGIVVDHSAITGNGLGVNANGQMATLRIGYSEMSHNATGYKQVNGSTLTSFGNNLISDNPLNTGTLGSIAPS